MKPSLFTGSFLMTIVVGALTMFLAGCSMLSPCKPGKPGKPKPYDVTVNLDQSLQQGSVVVDLIAANPTDLPRWEAYSLNTYWKEGDPRRTEADKVTFSFVSGQTLTNSLGKTDPKWTKWMAQGATHLVVLADLPGGRVDKPGTQDERRQILPLDPCHWPKKTAGLMVQVQRSGIRVLTPPRPAK